MRQSFSYINTPTETSHAQRKHPFCCVNMVCLFELSRRFQPLAELQEHDRLSMFRKGAVFHSTSL